MRVESFLLESARRFPGKTALVCGPTRLSYQELAARSTAFAAHLSGPAQLDVQLAVSRAPVSLGASAGHRRRCRV